MPILRHCKFVGEGFTPPVNFDAYSSANPSYRGGLKPSPQSVKKEFFDRLSEVTKAVKTSNSTPKCMWILERGSDGSAAGVCAKENTGHRNRIELCSKSKHLA